LTVCQIGLGNSPGGRVEGGEEGAFSSVLKKICKGTYLTEKTLVVGRAVRKIEKE